MMLHTGYHVCLQKNRPLACAVVLLCLLLSACEGESRPFEEAAEIASLDLVSIAVVPPVNTEEGLIINQDEQVQLGLVGISDVGISFNLDPDERRWESTDASVLSISEDGLVTGQNDGSATIVVSVGNIPSAEFPMTVSDAELTSINSIVGEDNLERCVPGEYYATGLYDDASVRTLTNVGFSLQLSSTAILENANLNTAVINANTAGALTLTAVVGDLTAFERQLTVLDTLQSISVSPNPASLDEDDAIEFTAVGTYLSAEGVTTTRDITDEIVWVVDESGGGEASVDSIGDDDPGRLEAETEGTVRLQAFCGLDVTDVGQSVTVIIDEEDDDDDDDDDE